MLVSRYKILNNFNIIFQVSWCFIRNKRKISIMKDLTNTFSPLLPNSISIIKQGKHILPTKFRKNNLFFSISIFLYRKSSFSKFFIH